MDQTTEKRNIMPQFGPPSGLSVSMMVFTGVLCRLEKLVKILILSLVCALAAYGTAANADQPINGELIVAYGKVTSLDDNGYFEIEGSEYIFRLNHIRLSQNFPKEEFIGQRVSCISVFSLEDYERYESLSDDVIVANCAFRGLFLRGSVNGYFLDSGMAWNYCDPQGHYPLGCPYED